MQHKKLRRILKRYGRRVRAVQGKHRDENILKLMEMEKGRQEFVKFPAFARGQIGMIGKYSLLWYVIWLVLFVWGLNGDGMNVLGGHRNEILLSVMPPFLLLLTAQDISRLFSDSMVELEKTTKFTPEHVVMVHFLSMSATHVLLLLMGIVLVENSLASGFMEILLYGYTPLILTTAVFLEITRRLRGDNLRLAGVTVVAGVICLLVFMGTKGVTLFRTVDIYSPDMLTVWKAALAVGTVFCVLEILWVLRKEWAAYGIGNKRYIKGI